MKLLRGIRLTPTSRYIRDKLFTSVALTASDTAKAFQRAGELTLKFRSAGRADYYGVGIDPGREIGEA